MDKKDSVDQELSKVLEDLNKLSEQIIFQQGYASEVTVIKALSELIREQLINESTNYSARTSRGFNSNITSDQEL